MFFIQFVLSILLANALHQFEQGQVNHFYYADNLNLILYKTTTQFREEELFIAFQKEFSQVPDVYLNMIKFDFEYTFPQGYSLDITSITTLGFKVKAVCESSEQYYGFIFNWLAFNDDNVQVINNFNITNPNSQYTHTYIKNCKINVALSNFVSYYALGPQFNNLTGLLLTKDTVTISFYISNLKQIGYQILLSSSDFFLIGPTITSISPTGSGQDVNFPTGWNTQFCYPNLLGFQHDGTDKNVRIEVQTFNSPSLNIGYYPWYTTLFQSIQYNYFCVNDAYFDLAIFDGLMQTTFFDKKNQIVTRVVIQEINYDQTQIIEEEITISESILQIKIIYYWRCSGDEQLKLQFSCTEVWCSSTYIQCKTKKINSVRLQAKYYFQMNGQHNIKITNTSTSFTATQIIKQQNSIEKVLFKVEKVL